MAMLDSDFVLWLLGEQALSMQSFHNFEVYAQTNVMSPLKNPQFDVLEKFGQSVSTLFCEAK